MPETQQKTEQWKPQGKLQWMQKSAHTRPHQRGARWIAGLMASAALVFGAESRADQFAGQDVNVIVNYSAGGPTDIEARIVAQYLPKYLPGVRSVTVRNVGGGGGVIGVNQLGAGLDKNAIGFFTWDPMDQIVEDSNLKVRYEDLQFIAGFKVVALAYMRSDTPPGIHRPADIAKTKGLRVGVLSPTNHQTMRLRLALDLLGVSYDIIPGYRGLRDVELAVQQGDLNLAGTSLVAWRVTVKPNLADKNIVLPVFQFDSELAGGKLGRNPDLPDVPSFLEVYQEVKGSATPPDDERWKSLRLLNRIMDSMYRTVFMQPKAPAGQVEEMRAAFAKLATDQEFIAAYEHVVRSQPHMLVGPEGEAIVQDLAHLSPEQLKFMRHYVASER